MSEDRKLTASGDRCKLLGQATSVLFLAGYYYSAGAIRGDYGVGYYAFMQWLLIVLWVTKTIIVVEWGNSFYEKEVENLPLEKPKNLVGDDGELIESWLTEDYTQYSSHRKFGP